MWRVLLFLCLPFGLLSANTPQPVYRIAPPPAWVEVHTPSVPDRPPLDQIVDGVHRLLIERQCDPATASVYQHEANQIVSRTGIQNGSEVRLIFDPVFEQITLHHLRVTRGGRTEDRTASTEIRVLQREEDMDYHLLDGRLMLSVHLEDIRVGDVVDWAWTVTGVHPTMNGRFFDSFLASGEFPVHEMRLTVRVPENRSIHYRLHNGAPAPRISPSGAGAGVVWSWHWTNTAPWHDEPSQPTWSDAKPWIDLSEHAAWAETVAWALPLYDPDTPKSRDWSQWLQECRAAGNSEQQVLYALRFVQDEIRYLGIEMGAGSHRPNPPSKVLQRRFGDCKDKSLLFVSLVRALGLKAWPALVNTQSRHAIENWLPSPYNFDHVIVALEWNGQLLFLDPTRTLQRGPLSQIYVEDYGRALLIREGESGLVPMHPTPSSLPRTEVTETYDCPSPEAPAILTVRTLYKGAAAEEARNDLAASGLEKLQQDYLEYYAQTHRFIRATQPLLWQDDPESNTIESKESYTVDELWLSTDEGSKNAEFYPQMIRDLVQKPSQAVRQTPFAIDHPHDLRLIMRINLWEAWNFPNRHQLLDAPAFQLEHQTTLENDGRRAVFLYHFRTKKDHVQPAEMKKYFQMVDETLEGLGHTLTLHPGTKASAWPSQWTIQPLLLIFFAALASAGWSRALIASTPPPLPLTLTPKAEDSSNSGLIHSRSRWTLSLILLSGLMAAFRGCLHPAWTAANLEWTSYWDFSLLVWLAASSMPCYLAAKRAPIRQRPLLFLWTLGTLGAMATLWFLGPPPSKWWLLQTLFVTATPLLGRIR